MTSIQKPVSAQRQALLAQFHFLAAIRNFFNKSDFIDVLTPPMVENPGMETHIHPYKVIDSKWYLHTSPEFHMKQLLSLGFEKIFTLSYCFRNEGTIDSLTTIATNLSCWSGTEQTPHMKKSWMIVSNSLCIAKTI